MSRKSDKVPVIVEYIFSVYILGKFTRYNKMSFMGLRLIRLTPRYVLYTHLSSS